jgi:hypothetical protein
LKYPLRISDTPSILQIAASNDAINKHEREKNIRTYPHHGEKSEQMAGLHINSLLQKVHKEKLML